MNNLWSLCRNLPTRGFLQDRHIHVLPCWKCTGQLTATVRVQWWLHWAQAKACQEPASPVTNKTRSNPKGKVQGSAPSRWPTVSSLHHFPWLKLPASVSRSSGSASACHLLCLGFQELRCALDHCFIGEGRRKILTLTWLLSICPFIHKGLR